ncbi:hypothetical protein ACQP1P_05905 [Dactylosporangium sp. CA-052675]|uniref:hypothetical protein n=1 Tax=Dactylosporangium sp. CA-052675 TaxID=3239927 RepID=UPI003D930DB2
MTFWFGLEPAEDLTDAWVGDAVDRAFDGPAWLRPRFPGGREVVLSPRPSPSGTVTVTSIRRVGGSRKRLTADLHVPRAHRHHRFALLRAAVLGLAAVGAELGLGPCPLRRPGRGVRAPDSHARARERAERRMTISATARLSTQAEISATLRQAG